MNRLTGGESRGALFDTTLLALSALALVAGGAARVESRGPPGVLDGQERNGRAIYRSGLLASGEPVRATVLSDVRLNGTQATCASCHGRSGLGTTELGGVVPPLVGSALFQPRTWQASEGFGSEGSGTRSRPAYTDQTLAVAIRDGVDPAGRELDVLMPRFELGDPEVSALIAHLKSLFLAPSPGVEAGTIHMATVVADDADPASRQAMLDVLEAFVAARTGPPASKSRWMLHVWRLKGPSTTWREQLESHYRRQAVFAALSGIAAGAWDPIHDFCETFELPCLFPHTDLPAIRGGDFYSIYLSRGLTLEAEALSRFMTRGADDASRTRVVQVARRGSGGIRAAKALRRALDDSNNVELRDVLVDEGEKIGAGLWKESAEGRAPAKLVLWLGPDDLAELDWTSEAASSFDEIYVSASMTGRDGRRLPARLRDRVMLVYPFGLPSESSTSLRSSRAWIRIQDVEIRAERVQANAYLAAAVAQGALELMKGSYSRDYFIELIEHQLDDSPWTSVYGHLSLARGQRFASKGCYIAKLGGADAGKVEPLSEWIIP